MSLNEKREAHVKHVLELAFPEPRHDQETDVGHLMKRLLIGKIASEGFDAGVEAASPKHCLHPSDDTAPELHCEGCVIYLSTTRVCPGHPKARALMTSPCEHPAEKRVEIEAAGSYDNYDAGVWCSACGAFKRHDEWELPSSSRPSPA